ncbi:MAG: hypothetical protein LBI84_03945, partial [Propionibacteriaceae bacterium]|nr:hypothetical protein [Propionibacteriaceae bacterium]
MTPSSAKRRPAGFAAAAFSLVFAATGFACAGAPPAQAAPADTAARAAAYLTDNIPATWDSVGAALDTALGLIASGRCDD